MQGSWHTHNTHREPAHRDDGHLGACVVVRDEDGTLKIIFANWWL
jgi:hypothetical protein